MRMLDSGHLYGNSLPAILSYASFIGITSIEKSERVATAVRIAL